MRILVDITHPAHVHFFRNAIDIWQQHGHEVAVTARRKDITIELLQNFNIPYTVLSSMGSSKFSLLSELIQRDIRLLGFCRKFKPDVLTAIGGVFAAQVGWLIRKPAIIFDDTEHASISHKMTFPFAAKILTPDCYTKKLNSKQTTYAGTHELAYLHPKRFTPDKDIVTLLGIDPDSKYCLIRFVSWQAHHDVGQHGFNRNSKVDFIEKIAEYAKPLITSESELPAELAKYQLNIPVHQIHHVMAFASLCITEGATMASESAVLGVPAVYINTLKLGYINMLEDYGLIEQTTDTEQALKYCINLLTDPAAKDKCHNAQQEMLARKIDVTSFVVESIENTAKKV